MSRVIETRRAVRIGAVGLLAVLGLLALACRVRGGGSLPPGQAVVANLPAVYKVKATFGFALTCEDQNGKPVVRGQLEYVDKGPSTIGAKTFTNVAVHGGVEAVIFTPDLITAGVTTCQDFGEADLRVAQFSGVYRPQSPDPAVPDNLEQGTFLVQVHDFAEPGIDRDRFSIELTGGTYGGYTPAGTIQGGNIQVE